MARTFAALGAVVAVLCAVGAGCGSGGGGSSCDSTKCQNDNKPEPGLVQLCKDIEKGPCGQQYKDMRSCIADAEKCTSDGHLDMSAQVTALDSCEPKTKAFEDCVAASGGAYDAGGADH